MLSRDFQDRKSLAGITKKKTPSGEEVPSIITGFCCKGVVNSAELPGLRAVLQVVGLRSDLLPGETWDWDQPLIRIAAIGAPGGIDAGVLSATFEACTVKQGEPVSM